MVCFHHRATLVPLTRERVNHGGTELGSVCVFRSPGQIPPETSYILPQIHAKCKHLLKFHKLFTISMRCTSVCARVLLLAAAILRCNIDQDRLPSDAADPLPRYRDARTGKQRRHPSRRHDAQCRDAAARASARQIEHQIRYISDTLRIAQTDDLLCPQLGKRLMHTSHLLPAHSMSPGDKIRIFYGKFSKNSCKQDKDML